MLKLNLSRKILLFFVLVSLTPLTIVMILLVEQAKNQLRQEAIFRQQLIAEKTADNVDNFLASKVNSLTFQSQSTAMSELDETETKINLAFLMKGDDSLENVALVNNKGQETIAFSRQGELSVLNDISSSDAFKATTFLAGKEYVGPITYNEASEPLITIAVPVLKYDTSQNLGDLSTAEFGEYKNPEDIQAVIIAKYNLKNLWESVLSTKIGDGGYAYVVDDRGNLVAHPEKDFLSKNKNLSSTAAVQDVINNQFETRQATSEVGTTVINTPKETARANWAVIVEEPVSSIFSSIDYFIRVCTIIGIVVSIMALVMSLIFRKQIVAPIQKLTIGAKKIGSGDFDHSIKLKNKDELQELATAFNSMGLSIKELVRDLSDKNITLNIEQAKLNSILRSVSDGVIALNVRGEIISINPPAAKLVDKLPDELQGKKLDEIFHWVHEAKKFTPKLDKTGITHYTELLLSHGDDVSYLDLVVSVIDRKDSELAVIITIHDLTPGRELDVMKLDFVAIAAHELRTPLTVVRGYLNLINASAVHQLTIYNIENLQKAIIGADQLSSLINNLLNISRIERGEMDIVVNKLDLAATISQIVEQYQVTATLKEQTIEYSGPRKKVFVPGDVSAITEVVTNLLGNALKFTPVGGTVSVSLESDGNDAKIKVSDNGPGIPAALRTRLFTKFYRVERSLVAGNRGTGLGLYISKTIIDLHHGNIGLEPDNGHGSTFYFTLPIFRENKHAKLISQDKESIGVHGWIKKRANR